MAEFVVTPEIRRSPAWKGIFNRVLRDAKERKTGPIDDEEKIALVKLTDKLYVKSMKAAQMVLACDAIGRLVTQHPEKGDKMIRENTLLASIPDEPELN